MESREEGSLSPRTRRALPLIAAAIAIILVASLLYVRANAPPARTIYVPPPPISTLPTDLQATYDFVTPAIGWSVVTLNTPDSVNFWIMKTTDGARHWRTQLSGVTPGDSASLQFFDRTNGVVTFGYSATSFYETHDGGAHWRQVDISIDISGIVFADPSHAWAFTNLDPDHLNLVRTTDGGATWSKVTWPSGAIWNPKGGSIGSAFQPDGEGWLSGMGARPIVYLTRDGGTTWVQLAIPAPPIAPGSPIPASKQAPPGSYFTTQVAVLPRAGVLVFVYDYGGGISVDESFDLGQSWRRLASPPNPATFADMAFLDSKHWWAFKFGFLFKTDDGGLTWKETKVAPLEENWRYETAQVIDASHAYVVMDYTGPGSRIGAALSMTSDGGSSWHTVTVPISG